MFSLAYCRLRAAAGACDDEKTQWKSHSGRPPRRELTWLEPELIVWDPELNTSEPEGGQEGVVGVFQRPDGSFEGVSNQELYQETIRLERQRVHCLVRWGNHQDVVRATSANAFERSKQDPLREVEKVATAYSEKGLTIQKIANDRRRSQKWVKDRLLLSQASPMVKEFLSEGIIAIGHAMVLAKVQNEELQTRALHYHLAHCCSVQD